MSIFEQASRAKLRFPSIKGELTTEQLWDIPLQSKTGFDLDNIAKAVNREVKAVTEESFVTEVNPANTRLTLAFDVVRHVIAVKIKEASIAAERHNKIAERDKLLDILADKQDAALKQLSPEEIQKRLRELSV